jgi:hypothetical protein
MTDTITAYTGSVTGSLADAQPVELHREIVVRYRSLDGCGKRRSFKTLKGAQKFAHYWIGEAPCLGSSYAVSNDGIGKITVSGCTLAELFPNGA